MKPTIVVTNDDGIKAAGIFHLVTALEPYFNVIVVAPKTQQSGKGLSITLHQPLNVERYEFKPNVEAYSVNGTPADCVKLAASIIVKEKPAMVVSGINEGDNSGRNVLYSGTVGATIEAVMRSIPGIAFSCLDELNPPLLEFSQFIPKIVNYFLENPAPFGTTINVNCPFRKVGTIKGVKLAKQGMSYLIENHEKLRSCPIFDYDHFLGASLVSMEEDPMSDIALLKEGYITVVPLHVAQITDLNHFNAHHSILDSSFNT